MVKIVCHELHGTDLIGAQRFWRRCGSILAHRWSGLLGLVAPLWQPLTSYHLLIDIAHAYFREVGNFIGSPQRGSLLILGAGLGLIIVGVASRLLLTPEPAAAEGQKS